MVRIFLVAATALFTPIGAHAQAVSQIAGLFNIISGLMLVFALLFFFGGLGSWFARLGTFPTYRDESIKMMQWGVVILFVLAALLALVQFIQENIATASLILGIIVVGLLGWLILTAATAPKAEKDDH